MLWVLFPLSLTHMEYHKDNSCHGGKVVSNRGHECWLVGDAAKTDPMQLSPGFSVNAHDRLSACLHSDACFGLLMGVYLDFTISFNPEQFYKSNGLRVMDV